MVVDTVISIERKLIAMEAILHRDQRTTSHRVSNRKSLSFVATNKTETMLRNATKEEKKIIEDGNDRNVTHRSNDNLVSSENDRRRTDYYDITTCQRCCSRSCSSTRGNSDKVSVQRHLRRDLCQKCINTSSSSSSSSSSLDNKVRRDRHGRCLIDTILNIWIRLIVIQVIMTTTNGAPLKSRRQDSPPMWVNPCGLAAEDFNSDPEIEQLKDFDLVSQIIVQSQTALSHTSLFREDFVQECFKSDFENLHSQWKEMYYDWLPNFPKIPKRLGEQLDIEYLKGLSMDEMLLKAYRFLQIFAVALEQIVWDQEDYKLPFYKYFREAELKLRAVLCEVQAALVERAVPLGEDVTRDVMADEFRKTASSATFRNLRDFLILRDYINCLEFVNQLCEYLRTTLPPS